MERVGGGGDAQIFTAPDGFPYVRFDLPPQGVAVQTNCLSNICAWCAEQGFGVAFFNDAADDAMSVQYAIPTGVLESLRKFGSWDGDPVDRAVSPSNTDSNQSRLSEDNHPVGVIEYRVEQDRKVMVGAPSADYLPRHSARLLFRHLTQGWKMAEPRVSLLLDPTMQPTRHLVIGKKPSEFPDQNTASRHARMLLWYFPPGRSMLLMPEDWALDQMTPLRSLCE